MPYIFKNIRFSTTLFIVFVTFLSCKGKQMQEDSEHMFTNALIDETSPYLLQHAHNPVNWRAWSQDALDDAKKENKLVLVSIGYSSCHWCHVMEEETFEDEGVAKIMNDNFINIKVDREERPDVDHIYQTAIELIRGAGGWPLNAIILPNGKPIYLGTYHTQKQWNEVLSQFSEQYGQDAKKMEAYADMLAQGIQDQNMIKPSVDFEELSKDLLNESVDTWKTNWDVEWGGDKGNEKYMTPVNLEFLLDYAILSEDESVKAHVRNTLDKIIMGGVYDHVGGGFYRYSTDSQWKIPHFEKMLYDNAQLLGLYAKAYSIYKDENYKKIVLGITTFLEREMKNVEGGYYAAMDADSDGEEGAYYVWTNDELKTILKEDITLFSEYYNINPQTVWENGNYVLHKLVDDSTFVTQHNMTLKDLGHAKSRWEAKLLEARKTRVRPNIDDKIITSWNALLASGFIEAYKSLGQKEYLDKAVSIFNFIKAKSFSKNQLVHTYKTGSKQNKGFLEDYAFLISTSLDLYGVTMEDSYFSFAQELNEIVEKEFFDSASQMYKYNKGNELIAKIIKTHDGVIPSPNAINAHNLFRIGHLLYDRDFLKKSKQMLSSMVPMIKDYASGYAKWNALLLQNTYPYYEIAVVGTDAASLLKSLNEKYIPNTLVVGVTQASEQPLFKDRFMEDGTYIYVCQNSTCKLPVASVEDAIRQLENF